MPTAYEQRVMDRAMRLANNEDVLMVTSTLRDLVALVGSLSSAPKDGQEKTEERPIRSGSVVLVPLQVLQVSRDCGKNVQVATPWGGIEWIEASACLTVYTPAPVSEVDKKHCRDCRWFDENGFAYACRANLAYPKLNRAASDEACVEGFREMPKCP